MVYLVAAEVLLVAIIAAACFFISRRDSDKVKREKFERQFDE